MSAVHSGKQEPGATHASDKTSREAEAATSDLKEDTTTAVADPPLPEEEAPPLPDEAPPDETDDGWRCHLDPTAQAYYFTNIRTGVSQWENPRVPEATAHAYVQVPYDRFANFYHFIFPFQA
jgi:hypothetical protein